MLITEWENLGIQESALLPELQGGGKVDFYGQRGFLLACLLAIASSVIDLAEGSSQSRYNPSKTIMSATEIYAVWQPHVHFSHVNASEYFI